MGKIEYCYGNPSALGSCYGSYAIDTETWEYVDFCPEFESKCDVKAYLKAYKKLISVMGVLGYLKHLYRGVKTCYQLYS